MPQHQPTRHISPLGWWSLVMLRLLGPNSITERVVGGTLLGHVPSPEGVAPGFQELQWWQVAASAPLCTFLQVPCMSSIWHYLGAHWHWLDLQKFEQWITARISIKHDFPPLPDLHLGCSSKVFNEKQGAIWLDSFFQWADKLGCYLDDWGVDTAEPTPGLLQLNFFARVLQSHTIQSSLRFCLCFWYSLFSCPSCCVCY